MKIITYTDGGSRGNPGPAACGIYIINENGERLAAFGEKLGITTNNIAEYTAIIRAFEWILHHISDMPSVSGIEARMDSQLACRQLSGIYKVKNEGIRALFYRVQKLVEQLGVPVVYRHVPREENTHADMQVNLALDN